MNTIWIIFQLFVGYNLVLPIFLYLLSLFANRRRTIELGSPALDYAIIVTAYEQTHMLEATIKSILVVNHNRYHIYVVADNCDISEIEISHPKLSIFRPEKVLASNTKSHFYAIERFVRKHDILTIIDSDNLVDPEYLNGLNEFFKEGFQAVQGVRKPKKLTSTLACLDAARDLYYNFYDGKILFSLGSSATLAGSGMAFKTELYKDCLVDVEIEGAGFDKVLQARLLNKGVRIAYAPEAIVYDEKTARPSQLISQRSRWIGTWFKYASLGGGILINGVKRRNINQFLFGIIILRPPLFFFVVASLICLLLNLFFYPLHAMVWGIGLSLFVIGFFVALIKQETSKEIYKSLVAIPTFVYYQLVSLYQFKSKGKASIATKHE